MESLHAPWRIEYILSPKPELKEGLFARIAQSSDDVANLVVVRDRSCFALLNRYPYNGGHLMVVPYKETPDLNGLTDEEITDLWKLVRRCTDALKAVMKPDGSISASTSARSRARASRNICTSTSCRAGMATQISCRCWPTRASCRCVAGNCRKTAGGVGEISGTIESFFTDVRHTTNTPPLCCAWCGGD